MKRLIIVCLVMIFLFSSCTNNLLSENNDSDVYINKATNTTSYGIIENEPSDDDDEFISSWLTYLELQVTSNRNSEKSYTSYIENIFQNLSEIGVNNVFIHARAFADAMYNSKINVTSAYVAGKQGEQMPFDCFKIAVDTAKKYNMKVHAWINPYRVSNSDDFNKLAESNVAKKWYNENNGNVCVINGKIYFNPASAEVQKILLDTVTELMENYSLDGIHIDDYFYPENCGDFDAAQYEQYTLSGGKLSLGDFRRENINNLVSSIYARVKSFGENKIFSISPEAKINKNYNEKYADVKLWCTKPGYTDMIIPQIYYGFENESMPFSSCLDEWVSLCSEGQVDIVIGLALYKVGQCDEFAGEKGKNEWTENSDIIKRQVEQLRQKNCDGFSVYSSTYVNFNETFLCSALSELKSVL